MKHWLFSLMIGASFASPLFAQSIEMGPDVLVRKVTEDTMAIVRSDQNTRNGNREKIIGLVEADVLPYFDFNKMTRLAMGNNWGLANSQQQQTLINEFRTLLVNTYTSAFTSYKGQTVDVETLHMAPDDTNIMVRTAVNQQNGQPPVEIDYYMEKAGNSWKAYDFSVDGVRWVLNYRNTFDDTIHNSGVDGLIKALQDKNRSLA